MASIGEDVVAHAIDEGPTVASDRWFWASYEGFSTLGRDNIYFPSFSSWLVGKSGFVLNERALVAKFAPNVMVLAIGGDVGHGSWGDELRAAIPTDFLIAAALPGVFDDTNPRIKGVVRRLSRGEFLPPHGRKPSNAMIYLPKSVVEKAKTLRPGREMLKDLQAIDAAPERPGWRCIPLGDVEGLGLDIPAIVKQDEKNPVAFVVAQFELDERPDPRNVKADDLNTKDGEEDAPSLARRWLEICGSPLVPFSLKERAQLRKRAIQKIPRIFEVRRLARAAKKKKQDKDDGI